MIKFKIPKIDSFRLLVPFNDCEVICSKFMQKFVLLCPDTGEIDDDSEHIITSTFNNTNGIKIGFGMKWFYNEKKEHIQYLVFSINSKMLKENYFDGINKTNIQAVFNYVNSLNIVKISKESFLNAKVVDVDFCVDFKLTNTTCKEVFSVCYELTKASKLIKPNLFKETLNRGIEWGKRNEVHKAYNTKQFLKYYAKVLELMHNSTDFYNAYIKHNLNEVTLFSDSSTLYSDYNEDNILRIETTIKNPAHFGSYGIKCKTLIDLLNIDLMQHPAIFNRPIQSYMDGYKTIVYNKNLTLTEKGWIYTLNLLAKSMNLKPMDVVEILVINMYPITSDTKPNVLKVQRSKFKKLLIELLLIDKKNMIENKNKNKQISMDEIEDFGLIPIS